MKKMIPVTLILFLCLLVAFAFLCEKVPLSFGHADTMWIAVYAGGSYQVRNEKGQVLLYEDGACNGDMPVYETTCDYLAESPLDYFRVPYARELRVTCGSNTGREAFLADWDVRFQKLYGSGIETVRMMPDEASICGTEMTYELRFFRDNAANRLLVLEGDGAGELTVSSGRRRLTAESDAAFQYALNEDYTETFLADTVPAQTELTIRDPWGAQADVEVEVQP